MSHDRGSIRIVLAASGMTEQECDLGLDSGVNASREIDFTAVRYSHGGGQGSDDDVGYAHLFGFGSTGEAEFDPDCALAAILPKGNARVLDSVASVRSRPACSATCGMACPLSVASASCRAICANSVWCTAFLTLVNSVLTTARTRWWLRVEVQRVHSALTPDS